MMSAAKKGGLGRGLNALFEDEETPAFAAAPAIPAQSAPAESSGPRKTLPISSLKPGQFQPRRTFDDATIMTLALSIEQYGVLQPLLVRPLKDKTGEYEIIGGERRWRAAQRAQLHEVPVIIKDLDDEGAMEISLVDNLQREDLNAIDESEAYQRLMDEFAYTQEKLAKVVGKSRSHVANMVRLLNLPDSILHLVRQGNLSAGHARALITSKNPEALAYQVMERGLSVRDTERLATQLGGDTAVTKAKKYLTGKKDVDTVNLEKDMSAELKMKVAIEMDSSGSGAGKIVVKYKDMDQLDKLIKLLRSN
jgi:ParB family chromosome partitioning protein